MFVLLDGNIITYQGFEEMGKFEAPIILGEEALLFDHIRNTSVASLSELRLCGIHRKKF